MSSTCLFQRIAIDSNLVWPDRENRFDGKRELTYAKQFGEWAIAKLTAIHGDYVCISRCDDSFFNITFNGTVQAADQLFRLLFDGARPPQEYLFVGEVYRHRLAQF
jgi:hypothetical protein